MLSMYKVRLRNKRRWKSNDFPVEVMPMFCTLNGFRSWLRKH